VIAVYVEGKNASACADQCLNTKQFHRGSTYALMNLFLVQLKFQLASLYLLASLRASSVVCGRKLGGRKAASPPGNMSKDSTCITVLCPSSSAKAKH